jgi:hypothetical protein
MLATAQAEIEGRDVIQNHVFLFQQALTNLGFPIPHLTAEWPGVR